MRSWRVFVLMLGIWAASCSARMIRKPLSSQQGMPLHVDFADLQPTVASVWVPSISTSARTLQVPVTGLPGTPLPVNEMSRLTYTVTYKRRPAYVLKGTIKVAPTAFSSTDSPTPIQQPIVTLDQNGQAANVQPTNVRCSSLMVADSSVSCSFTATIFAEGVPPSGAAQATIRIPGTGSHVRTPAMQYDFSSVLPPPSNTRLSSTDQSASYLFNAMQSTPSTAVVNNFFEQGEGLLLPTGVQGQQPKDNAILEDTKTYTYTAYFGDVPRDICGKNWKVKTTATVESTSDGIQQPETVTNEVNLQLLGCDTPPKFLNNGESSSSGSSPNCNSPPAAAPASGQSSGQSSFMDMSAIEFMLRPPSPPPPPAIILNPPPGVYIASAGSTLCGRDVCSPDQKCFDSMICCPASNTRCGSSCCTAGNICLLDSKCMPPGSTVCGNNACTPSEQCLAGRCCAAGQPTCGNTCCDNAAGETCILGQCLAAGSTACGTKACSPGQQCVKPGLCCNTGETACGGTCCAAGSACLNGQCAASGSSMCAGIICGPGTVCTGGAMCCPVGSEFCGGSCCGAGNQCISNRCVGVGSSACGGTICPPDHTCHGGVCCPAGHTSCGGSCCNTAGGLTCIHGQCVAAGSSPCGGTTCPPGLRCHWRTQGCVPHGFRESGPGSGIAWGHRHSRAFY